MRLVKDPGDRKMKNTENIEKKQKPIADLAAGDTREKAEISEKDYSFETRRKLEFEENVFSRFYRKKSGKDKPEVCTKEDAEEMSNCFELGMYRHKDAIDFAAKTWEWKDSFKEKNQRKRLKRCKDLTLLPTESNYSCSQNNVCAYYRVVSEKEDKYILIACHVNLHGFHRGDLRFIEVNNRTVTEDFDFSVIGKLFLGDIVAVTKLCKVGNEPLEPLPKAQNVHQDSKVIWEAAEIRVLDRKVKEGIIFAFTKNGSAIVKGYNEAMTVKLDKTIPNEFGSLYIGMAVVPQKFRLNFLNGYTNKTMKVELMEICSKFSTCPNALGTIYEYKFAEKLTEKFKIGVDAFKEKHEHSSEEITELCAQMGQSAVLTLFDGRCDSRAFPMLDASKVDSIVRFSISNPLKYPTEGLWNCSNRIMIEGINKTFDGTVKFKATIETVLPLPKNRMLQISARVSREALASINFRSATYVVYQREPMPAIFLPNRFLKDGKTDSNGIKIIKTLYGGPSLHLSEKQFDKKKFKKCTFPSEPPVHLNDYQNQYLRMVASRKFPMVLGSSPFGCGKSMTIVMAAIEICKRHKNDQQFLITQSNYASVNLIDIARKVKDPDMKIMRYVSIDNRKELPEQCRTEFDLPVWMEETLRKLAYGVISHGKDFSMKTVDLILAYFFRNSKNFFLDQACPLFRNRQMKNFEEIRSMEVANRSWELLRIAMKFNKPNIIVITADTLRAIMKNSKSFSDVITIQIDEACQLPECTLISLLLLFPEANYGLIGDIKQLPPYCEDDLTGKLKEYGIGNTMERAIEEKMFPEAILRYVYRCHPKITELLSELFYDGKLISGVQVGDRNEFMRMRSDIWPNVNYPIICVDNKSNGHRIGTSCGNKSEIILVKQIVNCLMEKKNGYQLKPSDIGVISFYAAQTAVLTDSLRGTRIKCGTVDAFQGSEREVIILCCTNERISEFMQLSNRLNVAMSRARQATIIIGNLKGLSEATYWKTIVQKVRQNNCIVDVTKYPFCVLPGKERGQRARESKKSNVVELELKKSEKRVEIVPNAERNPRASRRNPPNTINQKLETPTDKNSKSSVINVPKTGTETKVNEAITTVIASEKKKRHRRRRARKNNEMKIDIPGLENQMKDLNISE